MIWSHVIGAVLYTLTASLGLRAALRGSRYGRWHHVFYFASCASAFVAVIVDPTWYLLPVFLVLAAMPFSRAGSRGHAIMGIVGWFSWLLLLIRSL